MAKSLKEYKPAAIEHKKLHKSSLGGKSKTIKFSEKEQPALARLLAHLFASLKT